jgi:hypothetical protein
MSRIFNHVAKQGALTVVAATVGITGVLAGVGLAINHDPFCLGGLLGGAAMLGMTYRRWKHANGAHHVPG